MAGLVLPVPEQWPATQGFAGHNSREAPGSLAPDGLRARIARVPGWPYFDHLHKAQDRACPVGTPVVAPARGIIVQQGVLARFGDGRIDGEIYQWLLIRRTASSQTLILATHLSKLLVHAGQLVGQAKRMSLSGESGIVTGPHIHWEVVTAAPNLTPWAAWQLGVHHAPGACVEGGVLAGERFLVSNV